MVVARYFPILAPKCLASPSGFFRHNWHLKGTSAGSQAVAAFGTTISFNPQLDISVITKSLYIPRVSNTLQFLHFQISGLCLISWMSNASAVLFYAALPDYHLEMHALTHVTHRKTPHLGSFPMDSVLPSLIVNLYVMKGSTRISFSAHTFSFSFEPTRRLPVWQKPSQSFFPSANLCDWDQNFV